MTLCPPPSRVQEAHRQRFVFEETTGRERLGRLKAAAQAEPAFLEWSRSVAADIAVDLVGTGLLA